MLIKHRSESRLVCGRVELRGSTLRVGSISTRIDPTQSVPTRVQPHVHASHSQQPDSDLCRHWVGHRFATTRVLDDAATQSFNRFAYYFGLPLFLFYNLSSVATVGGLANSYTLHAAADDGNRDGLRLVGCNDCRDEICQSWGVRSSEFARQFGVHGTAVGRVFD